MREPGRSAIGTWSGGRFLRFGEAIEEERLAALLRPGDGVDTVLTADAYGQGEADRCSGRGAGGRAARGLLPGRRRRPRLLRGRARRPARIPPLHRPGAARPRRVRLLPADGGRAQPRADRRRLVRPAAAPQPRPRRLQQRGGVGRDGGAARGGAGGADRRRPRPGQRLHPRPDLLPGALRRPDRLGDDHPQPVRALARRALPRRGRPPRREGDHPGGRLRRPLLGRPASRDGAGQGRPPRFPPRRLDRGRAGEAGAGSADRASGPG